MNSQWDCIVVGAGAAGLSAALVLGRARRRTLIVDAGRQSNRPAHGIGGLLGSDALPPDQFYNRARSELANYPTVEQRNGVVASAQPSFDVQLSDGTTEHARTILLATGMDYQLPPLPGINELWGRSVFHCPFCHGWEARDQRLAILASGDKALHSALLLRNWSDNIVICSNGPTELTDDHRELLEAAEIRIDERNIAALIAHNDTLEAIQFTDGTALPRTGALVAATMHQRSDLATQLGAATTSGPLAMDAVVIDPLHRTTTPGVFAAGDLTARMPQVAACVADGSMAAMAVLRTLLAEDFGLPNPEWPNPSALHTTDG